jgi:small-conductance mechanosensitive channel
MQQLADRLGIQIPQYPDLVAAGIVLVLCFLVWAAAVLSGRRIGPRLADFWSRVAGGRAEGIAARICDLTRYAVAVLILAVAVFAYPWPDAAEFILGFALALWVGLLVRTLVRGLHLPRWAALLLAAAAFVAILADVIDGLEPVTRVLNQAGFSVGSTRLSLLTLLQAAIALLILFAVLRLIGRVVNHSISRAAGLDATQKLLAQKLVGVVLLIAAFFIGIDLVGVDLTALAVFSGAFGLAIGFGFQKTFGNLIAGILLLWDRSIKPGDVIAVGDSFGHVTKIGVRAVSIVTRDGKEHLIPNENLMTQEVENWSYSTTNVRVHIPVGVSYDCDIALAQKLMIQAASEAERVLKSPAPNVWLREFGDSSVVHDILVWISDPEGGVGNVQSDILNRLWVLFKENDIQIPFPQRDIHVKDWPAPPQP